MVLVPKTGNLFLYHIYADREVKSNLNRRVGVSTLLSNFVINAYYLLVLDWLKTKKEWEKAGHKLPHADGNGDQQNRDLCADKTCF